MEIFRQYSHYGAGQGVGFVMVCVGFAFCLIGSIAPYWITAEIDTSLGSADLHVGVWYYCVDYAMGRECTGLYDSTRGDSFHLVRTCVFFNILLGLLSGLLSCCWCICCMCCIERRTISHGVLSFCSGVFGIVAFAVFCDKAKHQLNLHIVEDNFGWAFVLYALGAVLLVIASFVLCLAQPRELHYGMAIVPPAAGGINVNVSNANSNVNQYNAGSPMQSFEPLPNIAMPPPPAHQSYGIQPASDYPPASNYPK